MEKVALFEKVSFDEFGSAILKMDEAMDLSIVKKMYDDIELPKRATLGSAGYDFKMPYPVLVHQGETILVPTGIRCKMKEGWVLVLAPRSGLGFKYRMQLDNTLGIIDSDYYYSDNQGHIFVKMTMDAKQSKEVLLKKGMAFCQGIFLPFGITEDDDVTEVRNGGFGSTSK